MRLEYKARDRLRDQGFVVLRMAGSHGPVDLVAINHSTIRLIQVKSKGAYGPEDIEKLKNLLPLPAHVFVELWEWQGAGWRIQWENIS